MGLKVISDLKDLIYLSLAVQPATLSELMERDFLKNVSTYGVDRILMILELDGKVFIRRDKFYAKKSTISKK